MFTGNVVNTWREGVFCVAYFGAYDNLKTFLIDALPRLATKISGLVGGNDASDRSNEGPVSPFLTPLAIAMAGSASGMAGWFTSFPLDCIKTNIQQRAVWKDEKPSIWRVGKQIIQTRGFFGLYSGIGPSIFRASIVSMIRFSAYEIGLSFFQRFE